MQMCVSKALAQDTTCAKKVSLRKSMHACLFIFSSRKVLLNTDPGSIRGALKKAGGTIIISDTKLIENDSSFRDGSIQGSPFDLSLLLFLLHQRLPLFPML